MSDWNPQVVRVENVIKHPNADALDIVTVLGDYPVITKRDEYKTNDLAIYIPIDTICPDTEQFYFLCPQKYEDYKDESGNIAKRVVGRKYEVGNVPEQYRNVKARRLRGIYSQGLLVEIPDLQFLNFPIKEIFSLPVIDVFGLTKWEEEEEEASDPAIKKTKNHQQNDKKPEGWSIPYYDIDGIRKFVNSLLPGEEIVLTEKIHGANAGFSHDGEKLWVKSRNFYKRGEIEIPIYEETVKDVIEETGEQIKERVRTGYETILSTDQWWEAARRIDLENKLSKYPGLVFFGELAGQVKEFRYDAQIVNGKLLPNIYFFDIWDTKTMRYLNYQDRVNIFKELDLTPVPELYRGPWLGKEKMYPFAEGKTTLGGRHVREGFVLNTLVERYELQLGKRMQVKLVGEGYNLQK